MELDCKCHGVSGSCAVKTCRRSLPSLKKIGDDLHEKYNGAVLVSLEQSNNGKPRLTVAINVHKPPTSYDLVYMESSPDYCKYDPELGTLGTAGRECNKTSDGSDGCGIMCCGLGFNTKQVRRLVNRTFINSMTYRVSQKNNRVLNWNDSGNIWPRKLVEIFLSSWNIKLLKQIKNI